MMALAEAEMMALAEAEMVALAEAEQKNSRPLPFFQALQVTAVVSCQLVEEQIRTVSTFSANRFNSDPI